MKLERLIGLGLSLALFALTGCGSIGFTDSTDAESSNLIGMGSKGPISAGTVKVYAIRNGVEDTSAPIGQGQTDGGGNYSVNLGRYKGAVVVEVTGGSYTDEVSGATVSLKAPLRAAFSNVSTGRKTVAVTPLTELAYKKAKGAITPLTVAAIDDANTSVATSFNLTDIVSTLPIAGGATDDQKKYAAACGSISQLVNDNRNAGESLDDALPRILTELGNEEEHTGGLSADSIAKVDDAITKFSGSDKNKTGTTITPPPAPTHGILKLSTSGTADTIGAIDVTIDLPAGVEVKADAITGETASGVVEISGVAAQGRNKLSVAKFTPASGGTPARLHMVLITSNGFGLGEFVSIRFDVVSGSFPAGNDAFSLSGFTAKDLGGSSLGGVTAAPSSVAAVN